MIIDKLLRVALLGSAWVLYLLMALSVLSISTMIERALWFRKNRADLEKLRAAITPKLKAQAWDDVDRELGASQSVEARVVRAGLEWREGGAEAFSSAVDSEFSRQKPELERGLNLLGTLGNNAPFVGLLGTVIGVIEAFNHLGNQDKGAMDSVMAGIAEALVATGVGLFVALPAVVAYNVVQKKIGDVETGVAELSKLVTAALHLPKRAVDVLAAEPAPAHAHAGHAPAGHAAHAQTVAIAPAHPHHANGAAPSAEA